MRQVLNVHCKKINAHNRNLTCIRPGYGGRLEDKNLKNLVITGLYIALSLRDITAVPAYEIMGIFYGICLMAIAPGVFYVLAGIFSGAL